MQVINNPQVYMEPGTYWIGDLCYVMDEDWDEVCNLVIDEHTVKDGGFCLKDGREFVLFSTKWGDGTYRDTNGNNYPVDSGGIGCIRVSDIPDAPHYSISLGNIVTFDKGFVCEYVNGTIYFGRVEINTDPSDEEYEEEEEEYEDEN